MTLIDVPSGWMYGFPKPIPEDRKKDSLVWLVEQGYPQELIDKLGEHFYCRYWEQPDIEIDMDNLCVKLDGKTHTLCKQHILLLHYLVKNRDKIAKREDILREAWGSDVVVDSHTIDVHVCEIRKKLGKDCIRTYKRTGYKWTK